MKVAQQITLLLLVRELNINTEIQILVDDVSQLQNINEIVKAIESTLVILLKNYSLSYFVGFVLFNAYICKD